LDVFIDGFANFSLYPYIIYDHLKCVSRLHATLYKSPTMLSAGSIVGTLYHKL